MNANDGNECQSEAVAGNQGECQSPSNDTQLVQLMLQMRNNLTALSLHLAKEIKGMPFQVLSSREQKKGIDG